MMRLFVFLFFFYSFLLASNQKESTQILIQKAVEAYKKENFLTARKYYMQACKLGNMTGCSGLGTLYERGLGVIKNLKKAAEYYKLACLKSDAFGCFHLQMFESGDLGIEYYSSLCDEEDNSLACLKTGNIYYFGLGVPKDRKSSAIYYQKSCNLKNPRGCFNLGILYGNGDGDLEANEEFSLAYFYLAKQYFYLDCKAKKDSACEMLKSMEALNLN